MDMTITDVEVKGKITKDKSDNPGKYPWHYTVDYIDDDGKRLLDLSSFDYGSVESRERAQECVEDAIRRYANGEEG